MAQSLLFIPDISGFTHFVQTTEAEHSQHVIAELLEVLIAANTQELKLAEVEGDALFFYKENTVPSQEKLLAQIESMYTAFYSHLKLLEKHRICPCNACASAGQLQLKIVAHVGELQFLEVQGNRKPFGEAVIQAHRLLKNSVESDNYVLISKELAQTVGMATDYESMLFRFRESANTYDNREIRYAYAEIDTSKLKLKSFAEGKLIEHKCNPQIVIEKTFSVPALELLEFITNYKYRHLWADGAEKIEWNQDEVTRLGTEHTCTVGGKQLNFTVVTKAAKPGEMVYGELTTSPPSVDELYQFYTIKPLTQTTSQLTYEMQWCARSPLKKLIQFLVAKNAFKKGAQKAMLALEREVIKS